MIVRRICLFAEVVWIVLVSLVPPLLFFMINCMRPRNWSDWRAEATRSTYKWIVSSSILVKKIAQAASNEVWLPAWMRQACRRMNDHNSNENTNTDDTRARVCEAFGTEEHVARHFATIDYENDIGGGCIASVHRATLLADVVDGRSTPVCVKIFRQGVRQSTLASIARTQPLVQRVCASFPATEERLLLRARWDHLSGGMVQQVDSARELRNHQEMREQLAASSLCDLIYVPRIYESHCAPGVLAIEWMGGIDGAVPLDQLTSLAHRREAARIVRLFCTYSLFHARTHHGDPHSGNFLARILDGGERIQLVLLDFGVVHTKSDAQIEALQQLCAGMVRNDLVHCTVHLYRLLVDDVKTRSHLCIGGGGGDAREQRLHLWAAIYLLLLEVITMFESVTIDNKQTRLAGIAADFHRSHTLVLNHNFVDLDWTVVALNNTIRELDPESNVLAELWGGVRDIHRELNVQSMPEAIDWETLQIRLSIQHDRLYV